MSPTAVIPGAKVGGFGYARMGDGRVYWFASAPAAPDGILSPGELRALRGRFAGWHEPIPALLAATPPAALVRNDVFHLDPLPRHAARRARTRMIMRRSRSVARLGHLQGRLRCALRDHLVAAAAPLARDCALDEVLGWRPSQ
jgi:hypothetical protein